MSGTTSTSGWGVFWFLAGFTILGTSAVGGGSLSLIAGAAIIVYSAFVFRSAREKEGT